MGLLRGEVGYDEIDHFVNTEQILKDFARIIATHKSRNLEYDDYDDDAINSCLNYCFAGDYYVNNDGYSSYSYYNKSRSVDSQNSDTPRRLKLIGFIGIFVISGLIMLLVRKASRRNQIVNNGSSFVDWTTNGSKIESDSDGNNYKLMQKVGTATLNVKDRVQNNLGKLKTKVIDRYEHMHSKYQYFSEAMQKNRELRKTNMIHGDIVKTPTQVTTKQNPLVYITPLKNSTMREVLTQPGSDISPLSDHNDYGAPKQEEISLHRVQNAARKINYIENSDDEPQEGKSKFPSWTRKFTRKSNGGDNSNKKEVVKENSQLESKSRIRRTKQTDSGHCDYNDRKSSEKSQPIVKSSPSGGKPRARQVSKKKDIDANLKETIKANHKQAAAMKKGGDLVKACSLYEESLALQREILGSKHPDTLVTIACLALVLKKQGDLNASKAYFKEAMFSCREELGPRHRSTLIAVNNYAGFLRDQGRYDDASILYKDVVAGAKLKFGPKHSQTLKYIKKLEAVNKNIKSRPNIACE